MDVILYIYKCINDDTMNSKHASVEIFFPDAYGEA